VFDLGDNPFGLVIAAIFGLSPTALISRLQSESEKYKSAIQSSQPPANS
jgi:hypothetical protein